MFRDLKTQFNILKALAVRDMQGQMKSYNYGFAWFLLEPLIFIIGFRLARQAFGASGITAGMTPLMFYVLGILPLYSAFDGIKAYSILASPSKLLLLPRVTTVDIAVASGISTFALYFLLFWAVAVPVSLYEGVWPPQNVVKIVFALVAGWIIGLAIGFALSGALRVFPPVKQFVGFVVFGLRMRSGFFFCIIQIPLQYWPYLTWNPLLHITEITRDAWFESYVSPIASPVYVVLCAVGLLLLGLSVERVMRRVPLG
jgi:capsular polysaccharide transport system permease protein